MGLKEWILIVAVAITLLISIPITIDNHKTMKGIEEYYRKRSGVKRKKD